MKHAAKHFPAPRVEGPTGPAKASDCRWVRECKITTEKCAADSTEMTRFTSKTYLHFLPVVTN